MAAPLRPGSILRDWTMPPGMVREVVWCRSAHDVIEASPYIKSSAAESCALYGGGTAHTDVPAKSATKKGHL
jgi:hypothetical protein